MAASATTDGGESPDYRAVSTFSFHDKHSGRSFKGCRYLNDDGEWDTAMWAKSNDSKPTVAPAPDFIQRQWNQFTTHRKRAQSRLKSLIDKVRSGRQCPICSNERLPNVSSEWVIQKLTGCPDYATDDQVVRFCPDCETNVWYDTDSMNAKSVHVVAGEGFDGPKFGLSYSHKSLDKRQRYKSIRGPEEFQEPLTKFHEKRRAAQDMLGYGPEVAVPWTECDHCGKKVREAFAAGGGHKQAEGPFCSHECLDAATEEITEYRLVHSNDHEYGPFEEYDAAIDKKKEVWDDDDLPNHGWDVRKTLTEDE